METLIEVGKTSTMLSIKLILTLVAFASIVIIKN